MDKSLLQFLEVATQKNVSRAASKLCLSQPALTHNMKKLEESLGVSLFTRTSNGVKLTPYGELLLDQTRIMRRVYENTLAKIERLKDRHEHDLRIGSGHAWWYIFLCDMIDAYRRDHPTANIHIDIGNHLWQMDLLLSGEIDLFIGHEIPGLNKRAGVAFLPLFSSRDRVFARQGHPLCTKVSSQDDLLDYPAIELTPDEDRYSHVIEDHLPKRQERVKYHLTERVLYRSNSLMTCMDLARGSDALLQFPACFEDYFNRYDIVSLAMEQDGISWPVGIYLMGDAMDDPRIASLVSLIQDYFCKNRGVIDKYEAPAEKRT